MGSKKDRQKFTSYHNALEETEKTKIDDPLKYTEMRALDNVALFWIIVHERNDLMVKTIKEHYEDNVKALASGIQAKDLEKRLGEEGFEVVVFATEGYPVETEILGEELMKMLKKYTDRS